MKSYIVALCIALSACGTPTKVKLKMHPEDAARIESLIKEMHTIADKELVTIVTKDNGTAIYRVPDDALDPNWLGVAYVGGSVCRISIPDKTFDAGDDLLMTVLWHELGHCVGLEHNPTNKDDIMHNASYYFSSYTEIAIKQFIRRFYEVTH